MRFVLFRLFHSSAASFPKLKADFRPSQFRRAEPQRPPPAMTVDADADADAASSLAAAFGDGLADLAAPPADAKDCDRCR